jgi:hypothetical protein
MESATVMKPTRLVRKMAVSPRVNAKKDTFQIVRTRIAAMQTGSEMDCATVRIKPGDAICPATMTKSQTVLKQQLLHQSVVTESAMEMIHMKRVQKMVAHTAVMESATVMTPTRRVQMMVASRLVSVLKDTSQIVPETAIARQKAGSQMDGAMAKMKSGALTSPAMTERMLIVWRSLTRTYQAVMDA